MERVGGSGPTLSVLGAEQARGRLLQVQAWSFLLPRLWDEFQNLLLDLNRNRFPCDFCWPSRSHSERVCEWQENLLIFILFLRGEGVSDEAFWLENSLPNFLDEIEDAKYVFLDSPTQWIGQKHAVKLHNRYNLKVNFSRSEGAELFSLLRMHVCAAQESGAFSPGG